MTRLAVGVLVLTMGGLGPAAAPGGAQTPFTAVGLGYPIPPLDARSAGLGGADIALFGPGASSRNPAELAQVRNLTLSMSAAPEHVRLTTEAGEQTFGRTRMSVLRATIPVGDAWSLSAGFSGGLDQDWEVLVRDTLVLDGERHPFEERRSSDGGTAGVELAVARRLGPVSVGLGVERVVGGVTHAFTRRFQQDTTVGETTGTALSSVRASGTWDYTGWRVRGGLTVQAADRLRAGITGSLGSELTAKPLGPAETRRYQLPDEVAVGASLRPGGSWLVSGAAGWAGWGTAGAGLRDASAHDVTWAGGGVEFGGLRIAGMPFPLRVGARRTELPFSPPGAPQPEEEALTVGIGAVTAGGRGLVDAALEFGKRGDFATVGVEESFRRFTISFQFRR